MKPCQLCGRLHSIQKSCSFQDLAQRVAKLLEANSMIPAILQANKEATTLAQHYQHMLKRADEAHAVLLQVLAKYPNGEEVKLDYLEQLDLWAKKSSSPLTEEVQPEEEQLNLPGLSM